MPVRSKLPCAAALAACCLLSAGGGCCVKKGFVVRSDWSLEVNRVPWMTGHGAKYEECKSCPAKDGKDSDKNCPADGGHGPADQQAGPPQEPLPGPPGHSRLHPVPIGPAFGPMPSEPQPAPHDAALEPPEAADKPSLDGPREPAQEELRPPSDEAPSPDRGPANSGVSRPTARRTSWTFVGAANSTNATAKPRPKTSVIR